MIDFFKPVESAWSRMEKCLFKPFDVAKWFMLGFSAWLASFIEGGGSSAVDFLRGLNGLNDASAKQQTQSNVTASAGHVREEVADFFSKPEFWIIAVIVVLAVIVGLIVGIVLQWVSCRGQFMFLDNLIHNRSLVKQPWKEFQREGNSLFFLFFGVMVLSLTLAFAFFGGAAFYFWNDLKTETVREFIVYLPWIIGLLLLIVFWVVLSVALFYVREFGVPLMYRYRCTAKEMLGKLWQLGCNRPLDFFVYLLVRMVMGMLFAFLSCLAGCVTCCMVGCLPYLTTVVLLPLRVFRGSYTLDCLRDMTGEPFWPDEVPPPLPPLPPPPPQF